MSWKYEYKGNMWFDCVAKGHTPVVVAISASMYVFCYDCQKVWRMGVTGKLFSLAVEDLPNMKDSQWKRRVLELLAKR